MLALHKLRVVRQITALSLLLLFLVSNTSKQWMHDVFANHVDSKKAPSCNNDTPAVHQLKFHCQCDQLVVESPISLLTQIPAIDITTHYIQHTSPDYAFIKADHPYQFSLRGPPQA